MWYSVPVIPFNSKRHLYLFEWWSIVEMFCFFGNFAHCIDACIYVKIMVGSWYETVILLLCRCGQTARFHFTKVMII